MRRPLALRCPHLRALALVVLLALCAPTSAFADTFKKDTTPLPSGIGGKDTAATGAATSGGTGFGRLLLGVLVVAALIFALRFLLKRANRSRTPQATGSLQVVATTALAQNRAVHLVRVGDELVLVGSAEQSVTQLRVYSANEARALEAQLDGGAFTPTSQSPGVGALLGDLRRRTAR